MNISEIVRSYSMGKKKNEALNFCKNDKVIEKINKRLNALEQLNGMMLKKNSTLEEKIKKLESGIKEQKEINQIAPIKDGATNISPHLEEKVQLIEKTLNEQKTIIEQHNTQQNTFSTEIEDKIKKIENNIELALKDNEKQGLVNNKMEERMKTFEDRQQAINELISKIEEIQKTLGGEIDNKIKLVEASLNSQKEINEIVSKNKENITSVTANVNEKIQIIENSLKEQKTFNEVVSQNNAKFDAMKSGLEEKLNTIEKNLEEQKSA